MSKKTQSRSAAKREEQKKQRVVIYIAAIVVISILIAAIIIPKAILSVNEGLVLELNVYETDITSAQDGEYYGEYTSSHLYAAVGVTIADGEIESVALYDYYGIDIDRVQTVFDAVIEYQMLNVPDDNIGTQPTDKIVLKAMEKALAQT